MKKIVLISFCIIFSVLFTGCSECGRNTESIINVGNYYLEGSQEEHIEIIDQSSLIFHNIDFSDLKSFLEENNIEVDIKKLNAEMNCTHRYYFVEDWDSLMINTPYQISLMIEYNYSNQLILQEKTYILQIDKAEH